MKTGAEFRESLNDGRRVFIDGELVEDLASHRDLEIPVARAAEAYDYFHATGADVNPYLVPGGKHSEGFHQNAGHFEGLLHITYNCSMAFLTAADKIATRRPQGAEAIRAYMDHVRRNDLRMTECITDAKGDRTLSPSKQVDPDLYLRVVDRRSDGIVIRGAKMHVSLACLGQELAVMPTKAMKPGEEQFAVACAVPTNAPGVKVVSAGAMPPGDIRDFPISAQRHLPHCLVIFDDVFVPNERVFLDGEIDLATSFVYSLGLWLRSSTLQVMADDADVLVGLAQLIAEANGLAKVDHIRAKIADMIMHATVLRATLHAANATGTPGPDGTVLPNELYTNVGKYIGANDHMTMLRNLIDIAGGSACTVPSLRDLENSEIGPLVRKYMVGPDGVDGEYRSRLFHAIRDVAASDNSGRTAVAMMHGGGGLFAQRFVTRAQYDMENAKALALRAAGIARGGSHH